MRHLGLAVLWLALAGRIGVAIVGRETIDDGHLTLACAAFFLVSAVLGDRIFVRRLNGVLTSDASSSSPMNESGTTQYARGAGWVPSVAATNGTIPIHPERTDLAALLRSSLAPLVAQTAGERIELRVVAIEPVPHAVVDRDKIAWAIVTLAGNALRYVVRGDESTAGGSVIVHLVHDAGAGEVAISVHDDGPGVPADKLPHLFVRRPGALHADGLALSLVRDVVGAHNGRIEVESASEAEVHGTSITIRLKCAD